MYTTLGPDPRRATIVPVGFDEREPERIGTGQRHACEVLVHPEERLPATGSGGSQAENTMGPDPESSEL